MVIQFSVEKFADFLSICYSDFKKIIKNENRICCINLKFSAEDARYMIQKS